jgi:hypothetical protein
MEPAEDGQRDDLPVAASARAQRVTETSIAIKLF